MNPFRLFPKNAIRKRLALPGLAVLFVLLIILGVFCDGFLGLPSTQYTVLHPVLSDAKGPPLVAVRNLYSDLVAAPFQVPSVCWPGNAESVFQQKQCSIFWWRLILGFFLSGFPLIGLGGYFYLATHQVRRFYDSAALSVLQTQARFYAQVTDPPEAPREWFAWFHVLRKVNVQLQTADKNQITVYLPHEQRSPRSGDRLLVFDAGVFFKKRRYVAVVHAPHVSIVKGE